MFRYFTVLVLAASAWGQFQNAPTQSYPPQYPQQQYPAAGNPEEQGRDFAADQQHGVARIRMVQGDVNVKRGDNGQLTGAIMNAPVLSRDHLETGPGSRAEVELDAQNVLRLAPDTDIGFANLAYQRSQVQLGIGTAIVRVLRDGPAQVEIDTPSVAFRPLGQGEYRIWVFDNGTSQVSVRAGRIEMAGPRGSQTLNAGQTAMVRGDASDPEFQISNGLPRDQFDDWSAGRDAEMMTPGRSSQYVGADVYGAEDLDRYGNWVPSQYGQVWAPQGEPADWSPYSDGQWSYADYYGWTWVGYEPWGWAPYHYGRWFWNTGVGWCWWPGARVGIGFRWSPALVGFFGFGGGLGWVALAPFEVFHPWWGRGYRPYDTFRGYYRNAGIRGGAITASFNAFAGPSHSYRIATGGQLAGASFYRGGIPVAPNAASFRYTDRPVAVNPRVLQAAASRSFVSRQQFASPRPAAASGWQHFGSPGNAAPARAQSFASRPGGGESGWHSFGQPQQAARPSYSAPSYSYRAPAQSYRAPAQSYRAPAAPSYHSAPAAPHYSAPRGNSGGGGGHSSGGGHSGGGGGGHHGR